jgi:hypothetical protein
MPADDNDATRQADDVVRLADRRIGRFPEDKAVEIARQICAGLAADAPPPPTWRPRHVRPQ